MTLIGRQSLSLIKMFNEIKNIQFKNNEVRKFGFLISGALLIISISYYLNENLNVFIYVFTSASLIFILSFVYVRIFYPFYYIWMCFALLIGWFMSRILLTFIFYFIISPIALLLRLFRYKFLEIKINNTRMSYWNIRDNTKIDKNHYKKQF